MPRRSRPVRADFARPSPWELGPERDRDRRHHTRRRMFSKVILYPPSVLSQCAGMATFLSRARKAYYILLIEDVPSSVELGWWPGDVQAASSSSWQVCVTVPLTWSLRAVRRAGRWRWPLTRRNCLAASLMPAAHQRRAMWPSRQRFTLEL